MTDLGDIEGAAQAVALLDALVCGCGHRYNQHDPEDAECEAGVGLGPCGCRCFHSPDPDLTTNEYRLSALLAARVEVPCPEGDCEGGKVLVQVAFGPDVLANCLTCHGKGTVPGDLPLVVMGSEHAQIIDLLREVCDDPHSNVTLGWEARAEAALRARDRGGEAR